MLRAYFMQQWFSLADHAMEETFFNTPLYGEFAQLEDLPRMPTSAPSCAFAIGWTSTSSPRKSWPS